MSYRPRSFHAALAVFIFLGCAALVRAADVPVTPPVVALDEQKAAMAKLAYMVGNWTGSGWLESGDRRPSFHGGERIQSKLDGIALLVEGNFVSKDPKTGADIPAHATLGVITFDPATKTYRFKTWLATGSSGERELTIMPNGWRWEITHPRGNIRYTATFAQGTWLEIGERSVDGRSWRQFFEMRLQRQP
jgi:hypothetical protein